MSSPIVAHWGMARTNLRLIASQSPADLMAHRWSDVRGAAFALMVTPCPETWFAWLGTLDRLEAERLRALHQPKR